MAFLTKEKKTETIQIVPEADRVAVAVAGVGKLGSHHVRLLSDMPGVRLVGLVDLQPERAQKLAKQYGTDVIPMGHRMPADVKAVVVATPTPTHFTLAKEILGQGLHCFLEKPLPEPGCPERYRPLFEGPDLRGR